ncbi:MULTISPECIES: hypothetical protein [unclassified Methylobacterium]|uniref:hypothetical protein n=1 Tax=unclassified Methylobacterium TaxID=2615210 RepID=UPI0036FA4A05
MDRLQLRLARTREEIEAIKRKPDDAARKPFVDRGIAKAGDLERCDTERGPPLSDTPAPP